MVPAGSDVPELRPRGAVWGLFLPFAPPMSSCPDGADTVTPPVPPSSVLRSRARGIRPGDTWVPRTASASESNLYPSQSCREGTALAPPPPAQGLWGWFFP